jgi:tripartite-type tricarboxylate transporter receptor subunit TctC
VPHMNTGRLRIIAMVEKTRYAALPDIPTIGETVPGFEMSSWVGVFAPAATPPEVIAKLNESVGKIITAPEIKKKLGDLGLAVSAGKPDELATVVKTALAVRGELIKAAGIQPE